MAHAPKTLDAAIALVTSGEVGSVREAAERFGGNPSRSTILREMRKRGIDVPTSRASVPNQTAQVGTVPPNEPKPGPSSEPIKMPEVSASPEEHADAQLARLYQLHAEARKVGASAAVLQAYERQIRDAVKHKADLQRPEEEWLRSSVCARLKDAFRAMLQGLPAVGTRAEVTAHFQEHLAAFDRSLLSSEVRA